LQREASVRSPGSGTFDASATRQSTVTTGSTAASAEERVAINFNEIINQGLSADLITLKLEILGDLWFLSDSGLGNYIEKAEPSSPTTERGKMNYEAAEVFIEVIFKNPADVDTDAGNYKFINNADTFKGIYRVIKCESMFDNNVFKQRLDCVRIMEQTASPGNTSILNNVEEDSE
jgi:hypothetical protein